MLPQCLHLMAVAAISSAQYGQGFVVGGSGFCLSCNLGFSGGRASASGGSTGTSSEAGGSVPTSGTTKAVPQSGQLTEYPRPFSSTTRDLPQCSHLNQISIRAPKDAPVTEQFKSLSALKSSSRNGALPLPSNIIGKQISRLRNGLNISQEQLSAKCQRVGLDISRGTLAKIESGVRCVSDQEALLLAQALGVGISDLFPKAKRR